MALPFRRRLAHRAGLLKTAALLHWLKARHPAGGWCLNLKIEREVGLFAQLNWAIYGIALAESLGANPSIQLRSSSYWDPLRYPEWLQQYFDAPWLARAQSRLPAFSRQVRALAEIPGLADCCHRMTLERASQIVRRYLPPNRAIEEQVRAIGDEIGEPYLAVHFRGTDKHLEAPRVEWERMVAALLRVNRTLEVPCRAIFAASDEQAFVDHLAGALPGLRVVSSRAIIRSTDGQPIHTAAAKDLEARVRSGRDALCDCLLLSKSRFLIRTASCMSAWASVFEPSLPVLLLNRPFPEHCWFPDSQVIWLSDEWARRTGLADETDLVPATLPDPGALRPLNRS